MMMFVSEIRAGPLLVLKVLILFADCIESPVVGFERPSGHPFTQQAPSRGFNSNT